MNPSRRRPILITIAMLLGAFVSISFLPLLGPRPGAGTELGDLDTIESENTAALTSAASHTGFTPAATLADRHATSGIQILLLDSLSGQPIPHAQLILEAMQADVETEEQKLRSTASGRIALRADDAGKYALRIQHPDYRPLAGTLELSSGEQIIMLERAASVELTVHDTQGQPLSGVEVALLRNSELGQYGDNWRTVLAASTHIPGAQRSKARLEPLAHEGRLFHASQPDAALESSVEISTSNAQGKILWTGLPTATEYRMALVSKRIADFLPRHERKRLEEVNGKVMTMEAPPEGLSAAVLTSAASVTRASCTILTSGRLHGQISSRGATIPAQIKLYRIRRCAPSSGPGVTAFDCEQFGIASGPTGRFAFEDLRPGDFLLRAWWMQDHDIYFASAAVRVPPGGDIDAGSLRPRSGSSLEVTLRLVDEEHRRLDPRQVFEDFKRGPEGVLSFTAQPFSMNAAHSIHELLTLHFHETYKLHGIQAGRVHMLVQMADWLDIRPRQYRGVKQSKMLSFQVGQRSKAELELCILGGLRRPLIAMTPAGTKLELTSVYVRREAVGKNGSGTPHLVEVEHGTDRAQQDSLQLAHGKYEILARVQGAAGTSLVGLTSARFASGETGAILLQLRKAVTVSGIVRNQSGQPLKMHSLRWGFGAWHGRNGGIWPFTARSDAQGKFELRGVPPATFLESPDSGLSLQSPAADEKRLLELTAQAPIGG